MKVLIVEDDRSSRELLNRILSPYGECINASDGLTSVVDFEEALAGGNPFDLICMDIMMPHINGHVAIRKIREIERQKGTAPDSAVKIIVTTVLGDPNNVDEAFEVDGASSYIVKPIHPDLLMDDLRNMGLV